MVRHNDGPGVYVTHPKLRHALTPDTVDIWRMRAAITIAGIAAYVSYWHMRRRRPLRQDRRIPVPAATVRRRADHRRQHLPRRNQRPPPAHHPPTRPPPRHRSPPHHADITVVTCQLSTPPRPLSRRRPPRLGSCRARRQRRRNRRPEDRQPAAHRRPRRVHRTPAPLPGRKRSHRSRPPTDAGGQAIP